MYVTNERSTKNLKTLWLLTKSSSNLKHITMSKILDYVKSLAITVYISVVIAILNPMKNLEIFIF